ncbi:MAG: DNA polymerase/3'-5' exonuclease PolX [Bacillati bacterium ANGP1]|uniref:DNA polymerase beta n=1 Tax=Candidatus Segetimicrobium genomatis TaxID=2569760 RepID=A0A537M8R5_9BACT|nr:MAG: DNA polymerase/3'-5' exonuclease PolX [Terrabacteria group bacterium ANGP1]
MSATNLEIARIFAQIADLLELKQESTFRVNAYRKGSRALESLAEDVQAVAARGELRKIGGIGASLAEKIEEYLRTGRIEYFDELSKTLPPGVPDLMTIPEVGPKTALLLYERLGITDIDGLERASRAGKVRELPRLGAKIEQNILQGIERRRQQAARQPLGIVLPQAQTVLEVLGTASGVEALSLAGSIRRMRDTIADIDIVVATRAADPVMEALVRLPQVARVVSRGTTLSSVLLGVSGVQCDVRVVDPASFGAALQYFTGSKDHNVRLREMAVRGGLRINEYGVFRVADEVRVGGKAEEEVYGALGLPWIPPEIREDQGEIELAQRGELPTLVSLADVRGDLHMHTTWSDGDDTAETMARAAKARGYEYIAITDHSRSLRFAGGVGIDDLHAHARVVQEVSDRVGLRVLMGSEVDILPDGSLDYPDEVLRTLDLVIGSVHTRLRMSQEEMTRRVVTAMQNPHLDILGHPTGRLVGQRPPFDLDLDAVIDAARATETVLEINAYPERLDLRDAHVRLARDRGALFEIGTDAHRRDHLRVMEYGIGTARRGWVEAPGVINTWPLQRLLDFLED